MGLGEIIGVFIFALIFNVWYFSFYRNRDKKVKTDESKIKYGYKDKIYEDQKEWLNAITDDLVDEDKEKEKGKE